MSKTTDNQPQLAVELDLETASNAAFFEAIKKFYEWSETQPPVGPLGIENGWYVVTPLLAQDFLRRNVCNRRPSLATVQKYHYSMDIKDWRKTGQGLVFNKDGKMNEGQQRCFGSYFGHVSFDTYIVTDAPVEADLFAYYDDIKRRSESDALYTSGLDGIASHIAAAVLLSYRYENDAIGIHKQPKIHRPNTREVLAYSRQHPSLNETAHLIFGMYPKALSVIGHKGVAILFCDLVLALHGPQVLEAFLVPLGSGANLDEHSPILGLRTRLLGDDRMNKERILALVIKAFKYFLSGKQLGKQGLFLKDNEHFPKVEQAGEPQSE